MEVKLLGSIFKDIDKLIADTQRMLGKSQPTQKAERDIIISQPEEMKVEIAKEKIAIHEELKAKREEEAKYQQEVEEVLNPIEENPYESLEEEIENTMNGNPSIPEPKEEPTIEQLKAKYKDETGKPAEVARKPTKNYRQWLESLG
jgi:hypothetical protein